MECLSYCVGSEIDISRLDRALSKETRWQVLRLRHVIELTDTHAKAHQTAFIFQNGTLVTWGIKRYQMDEYFKLLKPFLKSAIHPYLYDAITYQIGDKTTITPHDYFDVDVLTIEENSNELKLSLSYGLSQSVKLLAFETRVDNLIYKFSPEIEALSASGKLNMSRKAIQRALGEILGAKSQVNVKSNFLYQPKFFWQHPTLESYYTLIEKYMDIEKRIHALNHKLDNLSQIFELFYNYLDVRHSHFLEVIIIALIAIEIVFNVLNFHF